MQKLEKVRTIDNWQVTARWEVDSDGTPTSQGPAELLIHLADRAAPGARLRGISSASLRRVEEWVSSLREEMPVRVRGAQLSGIEARALVKVLSVLPRSPRENPERYYRTLLHAFELLAKSETPEPLNVLADRLEISKNTLKTQLATARRRYQA